jgi:hypothetical protein
MESTFSNDVLATAQGARQGRRTTGAVDPQELGPCFGPPAVAQISVRENGLRITGDYEREGEKFHLYRSQGFGSKITLFTGSLSEYSWSLAYEIGCPGPKLESLWYTLGKFPYLARLPPGKSKLS